MKTAEITLRPKKLERQEKIKRKLSWRDSWKDPVTGEMNEIIYEGEGGDIQFFYDGKRTVPYIVDVYHPGNKTTYAEIKKFVNGITFEHTIEDDMLDGEVVISFTEENLGKSFYKTVTDVEQFLFGTRFCYYDVTVS